MTPWERFARVARGQEADGIPVALIVDSPWLPGHAGLDTLDYFLQPDLWLRANLELEQRFPDVAWVPGLWAEYGMAAEPSAFGARIVWHHNQPPSIEPVRGGLQALADLEPADPQRHGLMPLVLSRYADAENRLLPEGIHIRMVAARGPLAVAGWLLGITELLLGVKDRPEAMKRLLEVLTVTISDWLAAQLVVLRAPEGILLLDDIVGMLSPRLYDEFVQPYYSRILSRFRGLIRVYHNDTPCAHLLGRLASLGFDAFNFSHELAIGAVQAAMPDKALMGNVPPLDLMVRGAPQEVEQWAWDCIRETGGRRLILSAGGGLSPGITPAAIDALVRAARLVSAAYAEGDQSPSAHG